MGGDTRARAQSQRTQPNARGQNGARAGLLLTAEARVLVATRAKADPPKSQGEKPEPG